MAKVVNFCAGANMYFRPTMPIHGLLVNAINHGRSKKSIYESNRLLADIGASFTITDSGGFQIANILDRYNVKYQKKDYSACRQLKKKLEKIVQKNSPEAVCGIASKFNSDIVMALDMPVLNYREALLQDQEFKLKLNVNSQWANDSIKWRRKLCPEAKLVLPFQCYNISQIEQFMARIGSDDFDGVSLPVRHHSVSEIVKMIMFLYFKGIRSIHILGSSKILVIAAMAYLTRHHLDWGSFDSSTWGMAAMNIRYIDPLTLRQTHVSKVNLDSVNCRCPWCRKYRFIEKSRCDYDLIYHIANHNFWVTENVVQTFNNISADIKLMESYLMKILEPKFHGQVAELIASLRQFDLFADNGVDPTVVRNLLINQ